MLDGEHFGLLVYTTTVKQALIEMSHFFSTRDNSESFMPLPETALGSGLSVPDRPRGLTLRRLFPGVAVMGVTTVAVTAQEMKNIRSPNTQEQFW